MTSFASVGFLVSHPIWDKTRRRIAKANSVFIWLPPLPFGGLISANTLVFPFTVCAFTAYAIPFNVV